MPPRLILASASPRRQQLLTRAGVEYSVCVPDIDETIDQEEPALLAASRLAAKKALAVTPRCADGDVVLAADTLVVCGGVIFGKPRDEVEAVEMLMRLAGHNHAVVTCWVLLPVGAESARAVGGACVSTVRMREFSRREAQLYAASGEPLDKAGAYAFQGEGRGFVSAVIGSTDNVIGLPVVQVIQVLSGPEFA